MEKQKLRIALTKDVKAPTRGTEVSAGLDFYAPEDITIPPQSSVNIASGVKIQLPENYALIFFNKSGVAAKKELYVGACVVDEDYQGEVHLNLYNPMPNYFQKFKKGEKVTQGLIIRVEYLQPEVVNEDELFSSISERGTGGFGSTGK